MTTMSLAVVPDAVTRIERVAGESVVRLLIGSGAVTEAASAERITGALRAAPRHAWLVRRWLCRLTEHGWLRRDDGRYGVESVAPQVAGTLVEAYADLGFDPRMAAFHDTVLGDLGRLVRDEVTVQELLFRDGDVLGALTAYQRNLVSEHLNAAAANLLAQLPEPQMAGPQRIVELGGGAGLGATAALRALRGMDVDYLFTDVSRLFTAHAAQRFAGQPGLRYGLVDINADFAAQGVPLGGADAVLAGNVLHNAIDIPAALRRIRGALRTGGTLVFTEAVTDNLAILTSMQFLLSAAGNSPAIGSADRRAGTDQVFLDVDAWRAELDSAGFRLDLVHPDVESPVAAMGQRLFRAVAR